MCRMTRRMLRLTLILALTALLASCGNGDSEDDEDINLFSSAMNSEHTLAFNADNTTLYGWGANGWGQLGLGTRNDSNNPKPVVEPTGVKYTQVSIGGGFGVAVGDDGAVYAWGHNTSGQLGDNTLTTRSKPAQVLDASGDPLAGITAVEAGGTHCLALTSVGTVWSWGSNSRGQLGNDSTTTSKVAVPVAGLTGVVKLAAGGEFSLALDDAGRVWSWGSNSYGQLGDGGTTTTVKSPQQIVIQKDNVDVKIVAIAAGGSHAMAIDDIGRIWAWGYNGLGQLGDGTTTTSRIPVLLALKDADDKAIPGIAIAISAGLDHTLVVLDDAGVTKVYAWGLNKFGQLGNKGVLNSDAAVKVPQLVVTKDGSALIDPTKGIVSVTAVGHHSMARTGAGVLYTWGRNSRGQLGDGTRTSRSYAAQVTFP